LFQAQIKSSCYGAEIYSILEEIEAHKMVEDEIEEVLLALKSIFEFILRNFVKNV